MWDHRVARWSEALQQAIAAGGPHAFAHRRSAAALLELDGFTLGEEGWSDAPEVGVDRRRQQRAGVHRLGGLRPSDVGAVHGVPCLLARRTLVELGAVADADQVERALESALRRRLTSEAALRAPATTWHRHGGPVLRRALDRRPPGAPCTESDGETRLLQICRAGGLPAPVRQHVVVLGRRHRLDAAWPPWFVGVEVDGAATHGPDRLDADLHRQHRIVLGRWTLLRFTWVDTAHRQAYVLATVRAALELAGARWARA